MVVILTRVYAKGFFTKTLMDGDSHKKLGTAFLPQ